MSLSDEELDALSEKLLDKMLKRLAKVTQAECDQPSNGNARPPAKCGKVTIKSDDDDHVKPTDEDYAHARRLQRKHARK